MSFKLSNPLRVLESVSCVAPQELVGDTDLSWQSLSDWDSSALLPPHVCQVGEVLHATWTQRQLTQPFQGRMQARHLRRPTQMPTHWLIPTLALTWQTSLACTYSMHERSPDNQDKDEVSLSRSSNSSSNNSTNSPSQQGTAYTWCLLQI